MEYEVGQKVRIKSLDWYNENKDERGEIKFENGIFTNLKSLYLGYIMTVAEITLENQYIFHEDKYQTLWTDEMIEGLVEEEEIEFTEEDKYWCDIMSESDPTTYVLPEGYQFTDENGNVINAQKIVLEKKKKEFPKTYEECAKVLLDRASVRNDFGYKGELLVALQKLLVCRDAYWKIAGEEMGLGKPWEPDYDYGSPPKYIMSCYFGDIIKEKYCGQYNKLLSFPTAEMRDAFYENFDPDIEICKKFL